MELSETDIKKIAFEEVNKWPFVNTIGYEVFKQYDLRILPLNQLL